MKNFSKAISLISFVDWSSFQSDFLNLHFSLSVRQTSNFFIFQWNPSQRWRVEAIQLSIGWGTHKLNWKTENHPSNESVVIETIWSHLHCHYGDRLSFIWSTSPTKNELHFTISIWVTQSVWTLHKASTITQYSERGRKMEIHSQRW